MTFLLGLVAGLIIGWVVEWIIDWQFWRTEADEAVAGERQLREELRQAQEEIASLQQQVMVQHEVRGSSSGDDLEEIDGITPLYARRLADAGISTYVTLAAASPERLRNAIGAEEWITANTDTWVAQAQAKATQQSKGT